MSGSRQKRPHRTAPARSGSPQPARAKRREARPRDPLALAIWGVLALALAIRLWHIRHGLPDFLDEAIPLRRALGMTDAISGEISWNPHFFHYPSLSIYLHLFLQHAVMRIGTLFGVFTGIPDYALRNSTDPSLLAIPGRLLSVAFDVWTIYSVARIGERLARGAGLLAAALLALSATAIFTSRLIYTDTVMTAFAVAAVERMLAWLRDGGRSRLVTAVVLIGLATGSKYPAALLLLPLALVIALRELRHGAKPEAVRRAGRLVAASALGAALVFLITTPFILFDWSRFVADFSFVGRLGGAGHFGNYERSGFLYHVGNLTRDFGWPGLALLAVSLPLAIAAWRTSRERALLWLALLAFGAPVAMARIEAERYVIPLLPFVALLAADAALAIAARVPERARRPALAALALALLIPAAVTGLRAGGSLGDYTRIEARRWIEAHAAPDDIVVQELYGAPLLERAHVRRMHMGRIYAAAGPAARRAYDARPSFRAVTLPLTVVGMKTITLTPRDGGASQEVEVVARPADLNPPVYDPRLFAAVDWVITSSAVRGRFEGDSAAYAGVLRFYALLDSTAELTARFVSRGTNTGPDVTMYRLTPRTRAAIAALGPLPPLWWTEAVLPTFRERAEALLLPPERRGREPLLNSNGAPATWVRTLAPVFESRFAPLVRPLALELTEAGRAAAANPLARAVLALRPDDSEMGMIAVRGTGDAGDWPGSRALAERVLGVLPASAAGRGGLLLEYATALEQTGAGSRARALLDSLASSHDPQVAGAARARAVRPGPGVAGTRAEGGPGGVLRAPQPGPRPGR